MALSIDEGRRRIEAGVGDFLPAEEADPFASRTSFARLLAGTRAHVAHAQRSAAADPSYRSEVVVRGELVVEGWTLALQGRVDGLRDEGGVTVVEEVKTVILDDEAFAQIGLDRYPAYVLQLKLYLYLLTFEQVRQTADVSEASGGVGTDAPGAPGERPETVDLPLPSGETGEAHGEHREHRGQLVFVNLPEGTVRTLEVPFDRDSVQALLAARVREILDGWRDERAHIARRHEIAAALEFPFEGHRPYQAEMEAECERALDAGECLLVSAPPGLGKTAAALTSALRHALGHDRRVYFVTSKTTQQRIVASTLERLTARNPGLTAVVLRAKAKICANDVVFCRGEFCEFARDYPSKVALHGSREKLLGLGLATGDEVYAEGLRSRACPFELSLDLTQRADVVVGDYNYVFDPSVAIQRGFDEADASSELVLVIDEAHNLVDRARDYYSPSFSSVRVRELFDFVELRPGDIYRSLAGWLESLLDWFASVVKKAYGADELHDPAGDGPRFRVERERPAIRNRQRALEDLLVDYIAFRRESGGAEPEDPVLDLIYDFLRFARVMELDGDEFTYLLEPCADGSSVYHIVCLDPSRQLAPRLERFHAVIAMSATLEPEAYYRDLLGFPAQRTSSISYPSPFAATNRRILVVPTVQTTWRERARWYDRVSETLGEVYASRPGHWVAFFPSFAYLREIDGRMGPVPGELLVQREGMRDDERAEILGRLEQPDGTPRLLLAVLGGVFAEGIDLPGDALVGVVVVSPGLPRVSLTRELIRQRCDERYERGFEYAYLIPGLNRVIQAAGRLVRSEDDRGVVVLLDKRFGSSTYSQFFPGDWYRDSPKELITRDAVSAIAAFFGPL